MKTKRILSAFLSFMIAAGLFTGCSSDTQSASSESNADKSAAASSELVTSDESVKELQLWHYFNGPDAEVFNPMTDKYNAENKKGIKVVSTFVARDDLMKQYTMGAISGELPDIGMVDNPDHASFIEMGVFEDITDYVNTWGEKDQFFDGPLKSCTMDGKIYGLPHNSNCLALIYNKALLYEAGIDKAPETWEELRDTAKKLTKGDTYGFAISAVNNEEGTFQFMPWFLSAGADINDLSQPESVKALDYLNSLIMDGSMSRDVINWTQSDCNSQFIGGKAAMQINGPWNIPAIQKEAPDIDIGVTLLPKDKEFASVLGGENFGICTGGDKEAGFDYLTWLMSAENMAEFCERGGKFPPRIDSVELRNVWTVDPIYSVYAKGMEFAQPRGPHPRWPQISSAICQACHEVYTGEKDAQKAMNDASEKVKEALAS